MPAATLRTEPGAVVGVVAKVDLGGIVTSKSPTNGLSAPSARAASEEADGAAAGAGTSGSAVGSTAGGVEAAAPMSGAGVEAVGGIDALGTAVDGTQARPAGADAAASAGAQDVQRQVGRG